MGTEILAKDSRYVAVFNLPDSALTPFNATLPGNVRAVLSALVDTFNLWLREDLTDTPVRIVDQNLAGKDAFLNPTRYGIINNTVPACDAIRITAITGGAVADGSSMFCKVMPGAPSNGLRAGAGADATTWQFADGVHPTTGGHKIISDLVLQQLQAFGWIAP